MQAGRAVLGLLWNRGLRVPFQMKMQCLEVLTLALGLVDGVPGVCLTGIQERNTPQGNLQLYLNPNGVYTGSSYTHGFHHFAANLSLVVILRGSSYVNVTFHI